MEQPADEIETWITNACDDGWDDSSFNDWLSETSHLTPAQQPIPFADPKVVHESLAEWKSPAEFRALVQDVCAQCPSREFFNNPRLKFLHDAWTLAELVKHKQVQRVRLAQAAERWPDGFVEIRSAVINVETTIALMPGRKMGEEYKLDSGIEFDSVEDWIARAEAIPSALDEAIRRKAAKHYSSEAWLVVYLNLGEYGIRQLQTEQAIAQIKRRHAQAFEDLFVLWKDKIF